MKHYKKYILSLFVCLGILNLGAQEQSSSAFSLQQAIDYALKNSPNMMNANSDIVAAKYKKREIAGIGYPQLSATFDLKDFIKIPVTVIPDFISPSVYRGSMEAVNTVRAMENPSQPPIPIDASKLDPAAYPALPAAFGLKYQASVGASLSQLLFNSDYIVGLQAAKYLEQISTLNANRSKADVIAGVSKAYYMVLINTERQKLLDVNVQRLKKLYEETSAYNQQGFVELIDVERLEVTYNNLVIEKEKVLRLVALAEIGLRFQMGYTGDAVLELTDKLPETVEASEITSSSDVTARPEFQLLKTSSELNALNLKKERLGYAPTIAAFASGGYQGFSNEFDLFQKNEPKKWFPNFVIGASVNLSIFDGLRRHNRIQQAKIELTKTQNTMRMTQQGFALEAASAAANLNNAIASLKIQTRNRQLAQHVQEVAQKKYQEGVGSNIEVVTAEAALRESEINYYNAIYDMLVSKLDYQKATGTLIK